MTTFYIVVEANWEYDDNFYSLAGSRYGTANVGVPKRVFTNQTKAVAEAQRLNIEEIKGKSLAAYGGEVWDQDLFLDGKRAEFCELLEKDPNGNLTWEDLDIPQNLDRTTYARLLDCLAIIFYTVVEVEGD